MIRVWKLMRSAAARPASSPPFAGAHATVEVRNARLLAELNLTGDEQRNARFICAIALYEPGAETVELFSGVCEGRISRRARGRGGFGYDPLFIPAGYEQTFGELPAGLKQQISHRARTRVGARLPERAFPRPSLTAARAMANRCT